VSHKTLFEQTLARMKTLNYEKGKAAELCAEALMTDGAHHKQWYLEEILKALGFDLDAYEKYVTAKDIHWERGIPP